MIGMLSSGMAKSKHSPCEPIDERTTVSHLNSATIHLLRGLRETDKLAGLTPARLSALSVLVFGGERPLGRLAKTEGVAGPTMTRIVDGLVELGLATRLEHPDNARSTVIRATEAGELLMRQAAERRFDVIVRAMHQLSAEDRELLADAAPALRRLSAALWDVIDQ